jgi:hypothetical protein
VPVALPLILRTVAHERDATTSPKALDEPECELLTVILVRAAPRINRAVHEQFAAVLADELSPCDAACLAAPKKAFARSK